MIPSVTHTHTHTSSLFLTHSHTQISIDIGDEMRKQNSMLGGMDEDFDTTGGLLGASMKRLKGLASAGHNRWMCYMILFIVGVFFLCYFLLKWRS